MLLFFIAGFGAVCIVGSVFIGMSNERDEGPKQCLFTFGTASLVIAAIMGVATLISYSCSLDTVSKMENFYERNNLVYKNAVDKYPGSVKVTTKQGTVETVELSFDYTHEVLNYNENIKWYRSYQDNWFYGPFVAKLPANLDFIKLQ